MRFSKARSVAATLMLAGCATMGGTGSTDTSDQTNTTPPTQWPINTYEHVDLWLHGFAMIQDDTTLVPFFRRGYKAEAQAAIRAGDLARADRTLRRVIALGPSDRESCLQLADTLEKRNHSAASDRWRAHARSLEG